MRFLALILIVTDGLTSPLPVRVPFLLLADTIIPLIFLPVVSVAMRLSIGCIIAISVMTRRAAGWGKFAGRVHVLPGYAADAIW